MKSIEQRGIEKHTRKTHKAASAPNRLPALRSRWSKRAGLHVVHYALDGVICIVLTRVHVTKIMGGEENGEWQKSRLVETNGLAHRALDVQRLDVLPVLLEQRDEEVDAYVAKDVSE